MMLPPRRMTALDLLQQRMSPAVPYGINPEMDDSGGAGLSPAMREAILRQMAPPPQLPPGLPEAVQRSIRSQPSYGEGSNMPGSRFVPYMDYKSFAPDAEKQIQQNMMGAQPERERLNRELGYMRAWPQFDVPLPERTRIGPTDESPYSRPYNLGLGNLGALY